MCPKAVVRVTYDMPSAIRSSLFLFTLLPLCLRGNPLRTLPNSRCSIPLRSGTVNLQSLYPDEERTGFVASYAGIRFTFNPCVPSDKDKSYIEADIISTNISSQTSLIDLGTWKTSSFRYPPKVFCHQRHGQLLLLEDCPLSRVIETELKSAKFSTRRLLTEILKSHQEEVADGNSASSSEDDDAEADEEDSVGNVEKEYVVEENRKHDEDDDEEVEDEHANDEVDDKKLNSLQKDVGERSFLKLTAEYPPNITAVLKLDTKGKCRGFKMFVLLQCRADIDRTAAATFRVVHSKCPNKLHFLLSHRCCCEGACDVISTTPRHRDPTGTRQLVVNKNASSENVVIVGNVTLAEVVLSEADKTMPKYMWLIVVVNLALLVTAVIIGGICCRISSSSQESYGYFPDFMSMRQEALRSSHLTIYSSKESCHSLATKSVEFRDYTSSRKLVTELPQLNNCVIPSRDLDLGQRLGGGLFGDTYIADWKHRTLAAKRITVGVHKTQLTDELYRWLINEVKLLSKRRHKYLGAVVGVCTETKQPYILTEFIEGYTVKYLLEEASTVIKWQNKQKIYIQIAEGLLYLHSAKCRILHRDLRCANIIIDQYERAKIVDFGMTKLIQRMRQLCDGGKGCFCNKEFSALPASIRWTAPEILQNPQADENSDVITEACDVYSFGMVMWEMASHRDPFDDVTDESEVMCLVMDGVRPPTTKLNGMIRPLKDLMILCWNADPQKRPSCKQVLSQLKNCLQVMK